MKHSNRAVLIVEDDIDDIELITEAYKDLKIENELKVMKSGVELFRYLSENEAPFFILCDYNLPGENAIEIRNKLLGDENIRYKSVPFIIWSTSASENQIKDAYDNLIQGFIVKPPSYSEILDTVRFIFEYWSRCEHPKPNLK
ncbi:MAG: response regulator [Chitinophagaceae bacterium]|nr:MAG: response regulator [Chitinophagaceae bacterium]